MMKSYEVISVYGCGDYQPEANSIDFYDAMFKHYDAMINSGLDPYHCILVRRERCERLNCTVGRRVFYDMGGLEI